MNTSRKRASTAAAAVLAAIAGWAVAGPLAGVHLAAGSTKHIGVAAVIITALIAALVAWGLLALLERFTPRARTIWTVVAAVVLVVSLSGPLGAPTAAAGLCLAGLHLMVGGIIIAGLRAS